jgi:hypothetical protein
MVRAVGMGLGKANKGALQLVTPEQEVTVLGQVTTSEERENRVPGGGYQPKRAEGEGAHPPTGSSSVIKEGRIQKGGLNEPPTTAPPPPPQGQGARPGYNPPPPFDIERPKPTPAPPHVGQVCVGELEAIAGETISTRDLLAAHAPAEPHGWYRAKYSAFGTMEAWTPDMARTYFCGWPYAYADELLSRR